MDQRKRSGAFDASGMERQRVRRVTTDQYQRTGMPGMGYAGTQTPDGDENEIDMVELVYCVLAKWKLIVCCALAFMVVAGVFTVAFMTPMYKATSTIYVLGRSDSVVNFSDLQIGNALTKDYIKVFDLWEVHDGVIRALNLPYSYGEMQGMLSVKNDADTRMLDITITAASAEEAAAIANKYAEVVSKFIQDTMATDKPSTMSEALVPDRPASPSLIKNVLIGCILGCLVAGAYVVVRFLMDDKLKTAEDIRKYIGLTTLAVVPLENADTIKQNAKQNTRRKHEKH